jgi:hypothetical protein
MVPKLSVSPACEPIVINAFLTIEHNLEFLKETFVVFVVPVFRDVFREYKSTAEARLLRSKSCAKMCLIRKTHDGTENAAMRLPTIFCRLSAIRRRFFSTA